MKLLYDLEETLVRHLALVSGCHIMCYLSERL